MSLLVRDGHSSPHADEKNGEWAQHTGIAAALIDVCFGHVVLKDNNADANRQDHHSFRSFVSSS